MKTAAIAIVVIGTLTGCATAQLNKGLSSLLGQNIQAAIDHMEYPDGEREVLGDKVYVWSTNHQAFLPVVNTSTTTGSIGGTPMYATTNSMGMEAVAAVCTVQIATTPDGRIKRFQWYGNQIGCRRYAGGF